MNARWLTAGLVIGMGLCCAAEEKSPSDKPEPKAVGDEAAMLMRRMSFELVNTPLAPSRSRYT